MTNKTLVGDKKCICEEVSSLKEKLGEKAVDPRYGWSKAPVHGVGALPWWCHKGVYCWSHGYDISKGHNGECNRKKTGHIASFTRCKPQGGCKYNKGWDEWWVGKATIDIKNSDYLIKPNELFLTSVVKFSTPPHQTFQHSTLRYRNFRLWRKWHLLCPGHPPSGNWPYGSQCAFMNIHRCNPTLCEHNQDYNIPTRRGNTNRPRNAHVQ